MRFFSRCKLRWKSCIKIIKLSLMISRLAVRGIWEKKDNRSWMPVPIGCNKSWRHFLASGGIKEVEFLEDEILIHSCAFFTRGKWCVVFRKELLLTNWFSLGRWLIAWGRALWKHSTKRLAGLLMSSQAPAHVSLVFQRHGCLNRLPLPSTWAMLTSELKARGRLPLLSYFQLVIFLDIYYLN